METTDTPFGEVQAPIEGIPHDLLAGGLPAPIWGDLAICLGLALLAQALVTIVGVY